MSEADIRTQIKAILQEVAGIGIVHDYERWTRSTATLLGLMSSGGKTNGWMIHRQKTVSKRVTMPTIERYHTYKITGMYELDDGAGSEKTFQLILENIFDAFKANETLNGTAFNSDPISIDAVDVDEFGKRLFHTAELTLTVQERVTY